MDYEVQARRYDVAVTRSFEGDHQSPFRRFVWLYDLVQILGDALPILDSSGVMITFSDRAPDVFGTFDKSQGIVNVISHISDFSDIYRIIQSESPIFFRWKESPDTEGKIVRYSLHADYEAVGEGSEDSSP